MLTLGAWKQFGEKVQGIPDLVIAKYNTMDNENEGLNIYDHPTIIFYAKDNKKGVKYDGNEYEKFLLEHSGAYKAAMAKNEEL